jgi:hypothetical protein
MLGRSCVVVPLSAARLLREARQAVAYLPEQGVQAGLVGLVRQRLELRIDRGRLTPRTSL